MWGKGREERGGGGGGGGGGGKKVTFCIKRAEIERERD